MAKVLSYEADLKGGATVRTKLVIPVLASDPGSPVDGTIWVNSTDDQLRIRVDGVTVDLGSGLDGVTASASELNILDGATLSTAELNLLDGVTATTTELNYIDGVTSAIQTQLDGKVDENAGITGATKTKITYDAKGLVTAGADATQDDIGDGTTYKQYSQTEKTKLAGIATGATAYTAENAKDDVGGILTDSATVDFTYDDAANSGVGTITAAVLDSPQLEGNSLSDVLTAATAAAVSAIVDGAPAALDTLNEIAEALNDDAGQVDTILTSLGTKARTYEANLTGGSLTEDVTHNLATRDVSVTVYVNSGTYDEEDYIVQHATTNKVTIVSEGQNIPAGRRVFIVAKGA